MNDKKIIILDNVTFKVKKAINKNDIINDRYLTLEECYKSPSSAKTSIYNIWKNLFNKYNVVEYGISGYNCNFFSLKALIQLNGKLYQTYITYTKQEIREVIY